MLLVPIHYGNPGISQLTQELCDYGLVVIDALSDLTQRIPLDLQIACRQEIDDDPHQPLIHLYCRGDHCCGYGELQCFVNPSVYRGSIQSARQLVAAAARQWCLVGKPTRHLAVLRRTVDVAKSPIEAVMH